MWHGKWSVSFNIGIVCGAQGGGLSALLEAVALAVHLKDVNAVSETVQQSVGESL